MIRQLLAEFNRSAFTVMAKFSIQVSQWKDMYVFLEAHANLHLGYGTEIFATNKVTTLSWGEALRKKVSRYLHQPPDHHPGRFHLLLPVGKLWRYSLAAVGAVFHLRDPTCGLAQDASAATRTSCEKPQNVAF